VVQNLGLKTEGVNSFQVFGYYAAHCDAEKRKDPRSAQRNSVYPLSWDKGHGIQKRPND